MKDTEGQHPCATCTNRSGLTDGDVHSIVYETLPAEPAAFANEPSEAVLDFDGELRLGHERALNRSELTGGRDEVEVDEVVVLLRSLDRVGQSRSELLQKTGRTFTASVRSWGESLGRQGRSDGP